MDVLAHILVLQAKLLLCWVQAHLVLTGYDRVVMGVNASERLDIRAAVKADKFCK